MTEDGFVDIAAGLIKDEDGRHCMIYHQKEGLRLFPGGKVDAGESPVDALKREITEEVGVQVKNEKFL